MSIFPCSRPLARIQLVQRIGECEATAVAGNLCQLSSKISISSVAVLMACFRYLFGFKHMQITHVHVQQVILHNQLVLLLSLMQNYKQSYYLNERDLRLLQHIAIYHWVL